MLQKVLILHFLHLAVGGLLKGSDEYVCFLNKHLNPIPEESYFSLPCTQYIMSYFSMEVDGDKFYLDEELRKSVESISKVKRSNPKIKIFISVHIKLKNKSAQKAPESYPTLCEHYNRWDANHNLSGLVVSNHMVEHRAQAVAVIKTLKKCMDKKNDKLYLQGDLLQPNFYKTDFLYTYFDRLLVVYSRLVNNEIYLPALLNDARGVFASVINITQQWKQEGFKRKHMLGEISLAHTLYEKDPNSTVPDVFSRKYSGQQRMDASEGCEEADNFAWTVDEATQFRYGENDTHVMISESPDTIEAKAKFMKQYELVGVFIWFLNEDSAKILRCSKSSYALTKAAVKGFSGAEIKNDVPYYQPHSLKPVPPVKESDDANKVA